MHILVLAAGDPAPRLLLDILNRRCGYVIAADGGARHAMQAAMDVDVYYGDGDSITTQERHWLEQNNVPMHMHLPEKNETDLELALNAALTKKPDHITIVGGWGGRADHALSNLFLLERGLQEQVPIELWAGAERLRLYLPGAVKLESVSVGQRVSLVPVSRCVQGVTTDGLRYPLKNETLYRASGRGVSNQVVHPQARLKFTDGVLLVVQAFELSTLNEVL